MNISDIWKYDLRKGSTDSPANGACLFDAGMWLVYGKIGDNPPCSCPVIRQYAIGLNDHMPNPERQRLKPFILRVVGNRDPGVEEARRHFIVLETARLVVPLAFTQWPEHQSAMRALADDASYEQIRAVCSKARNAAAYAADAGAYAGAYAAANAANAATAAATYADFAASAAAIAAPYAASAGNAAAVWPQAILILDGALRIGKQSPEFDEAQVRESVRQFERARAR